MQCPLCKGHGNIYLEENKTALSRRVEMTLFSHLGKRWKEKVLKMKESDLRSIPGIGVVAYGEIMAKVINPTEPINLT